MIGEYRGEGVCVLTLSRPEKANALTSEMLHDLEARISAAAGDADLRALVLTGAGKVFCAGADLEAARAGLATDPVWERLSAAIANFPVLTIAALNGSAAGGSLGMVLACDLRVAVPGAKIFYPVMRLGFLPQPSDPARLAALVGPAWAKLILLGGEKVDASDAQRIGLVDRVTEDVLGEARRLAEASCAASREHAVAMKAMF